MKFNTLKKAQKFARRLTKQTGIKHIAIKTFYYSMDKLEDVTCYVVCIDRQARIN